MVRYSLRLDDDVSAELDSLSNLLQVSKNQLLNMLIRQEYQKYNDDPKIKLMLTRFNELRSSIEQMQKEFDV